MLILALDTTTRAGSLAILRGEDLLVEISGDPAIPHAQRLPMDVRRACEEAGVAIQDVDRFAVAAGPGSFTGLRIGIAAVQGLAFARQRLIVPVSTLEALAGAAGPGGRRVAAWMDAQRGEVFAQVFDAGGLPLVEPVAASPSRALEAHRDLLDGAVFAGHGALRYRSDILAVRGEATTVVDPVPRLAGAAARIAARHPERAVLPHAVIPMYVRRPDVELARERRSIAP